jgi:hypothetical protein
MSSEFGRDFEREQELRRLLADAVEPIEPSPGAETRLLARARAQERHRRRPLMTRLRIPAAVVSFLAIVVLAVVFVRANRGSNGASAGSTAASAPSRAPESSSASAASAGTAKPPTALNPVPSSKSLSNEKGAGTSYSGDTSATRPQVASLVPFDLDGDGRTDTFTLGAGTLGAQLSRYGLEAVSLPPLGAGARVLGVTSLTAPDGTPVAVVFVRLRQVGSTATDTIVSLVNGRLTVLRLDSGPVSLTIDATHGYGCSQGTLAISGKATPLAVDGSWLVTSAVVRAAAAATPRTSPNCY